MNIVREVKSEEKELINRIVTIHIDTFSGFFLTFMGRGFLNQMYSAYCDHKKSGLLVAEEDGKAIGFLAFSSDFSGLYRFMIKSRLISLAWYSVGAFFRRPTAFMRIIRAFLKPSEVKREEQYVELSSIGVEPQSKKKGIGSILVGSLIERVDFNKYAYIALETDAINNEGANQFYKKNGFVYDHSFVTTEGRKMNEYRYCR